MARSALRSCIIFFCSATLILALPSTIISSQTPKSGTGKVVYPQNYFRSPLDIPLYLSGSFGELRPNHFHSGLDIKTNAKEGYPVYAIADGYVSRIRVQTVGFGNSIYVTHPNGYVSVYAHLKSYAPKIAAEAKRKEYEKESFEMDEMYSEPTGIKVRKGELIAFTGNTGSSGGPHLHFEIRDAITEVTINPALFGMPIEDNIKPVFTGAYVYPTKGGTVNGQPLRVRLPVTGQLGYYRATEVVKVKGKIGFGIEAYDMHNGSRNHNGLYSTDLRIDGKTVFYADLEKFGFDETRYINSFIDYGERIRTKKDIQKSFVDDGNKLSIYKNVDKQGFVFFNDTATHKVEYIVRDAHGNVSTLSFSVKAENGARPPLNTPFKPGITFPFQKENSFKNAEIDVRIPAYSLYDTIDFEYASGAKPANAYSKIHHIHNKYIPIQIPVELSIMADNSIIPYKDKAVIVNERKRSQGGNWVDGFVKTTIKEFGSFYVTLDTIAPSIKPITIAEGKNMALNAAILIRIGDNLAGVKSYTAKIDGQWRLMSFDAKSGVLAHYFDERTAEGKHYFELTITDYKQNTSTYSATFYR